MTNGIASPQDAAIALLAVRNLHQCFWLPQSETHERLRITFSTTSNFEDQSCPVVLFCGPMFGTRYLNLAFDKIARESGVRVICVDRPGFGGSTNVPVEQRMDVWLEMVPALLQHLKVKHVSLVSHSAGTMYLLNTLYHHRQILDPTTPYAALLGPWAGTNHSSALLSAVAKLPSSVISGWSPLVNFVNNTIAPVTSWSGGIVSSVSGVFESAGIEEEASAQGKFGVNADTAKEIERLWGKWSFAEQGMRGGNDEARMCLGKGSLGVCEDYEKYVEMLVAKESKQRQAKLKLSLCFAEDDMMSGETGKDYLKHCWRQDVVEDSITVDSKEFPGTNHETVLLDIPKGALRTVFEQIAAKV